MATVRKRRLARQDHEALATIYLKEAQRRSAHVANCDMSSHRALLDMRRDITLARAHLVSIGQLEGPRTRKFWSAVDKAERDFSSRVQKFSKCIDRTKALSGAFGYSRRRKVRS